MICVECRTEIEAISVICPGCGARVAKDRARREQADWREQVRETVERHKLKKRRRLEERDDDARQLSIFPAAHEDEEARAERLRRAEIRQRVEERVGKRRPTPSAARRRVELGELPLRTSSGTSAAATARELDRDVIDDPEEERRVERAPDASSRRARERDEREAVPRAKRRSIRSERPDPTTAEFDPVRDPRGARDPEDLDELDLPLGLRGGAEADSELDFEPDVDVDVDVDVDDADASGATFDFGLASVGGRIVSGIIDLVFVVGIQLTLFYLTTHLVSQRIGALPSSALGAMGVVGTVLAAGYFLFFWALSGQTLGKLLTGARVVDRRGRALGFGGAAARLAGCALATLPLGAGFIGLWTDPERRGWHDRIAGSKVVRG